jgi:dihydroxy-acid dehydratase
VGHISPEAAARGPIAALHEGDVVEVDLETNSLNVHLSDEEIEQRLEALPLFEPQVESRWLRRYSNSVTSASTGAVLK